MTMTRMPLCATVVKENISSYQCCLTKLMIAVLLIPIASDAVLGDDPSAA